MLQYILEIIIWTVILYSILELFKKLIYKFIISPEKIKEFKTFKQKDNEKYTKYKTKSESRKTK